MPSSSRSTTWEGKIAIGEDGVEVPEGKEDLAREGVSQCPVLALQIEE